MRTEGTEQAEGAGSAGPVRKGGSTRARDTRRAMQNRTSRKPTMAGARVRGAHAKRDGAWSPGDTA